MDVNFAAFPAVRHEMFHDGMHARGVDERRVGSRHDRPSKNPILLRYYPDVGVRGGAISITLVWQYSWLFDAERRR